VYGFTCTRWFGDWPLVVLGAPVIVATVPSAVASTTPETASMIGTRALRLSGGGAICSRGLSSSIASPHGAR
jgi:hypothetical protein